MHPPLSPVIYYRKYDMKNTKLSNAASLRRDAYHTLLAGAALAAVLVLAGCNTTEGVGKDIESAGDSLKDTARDAKN